jgi:galactose-1-phosphate uridylyltransferase
LRNELVHSKPKVIEIDAEKFFRESDGDEDYLNKDFISSVESSIRAVSKCIKFLYKISPDWDYKKFYDLSKKKNEILKSKIP